MCMISLGLLALNGYRSGVIDILIGSVRHIGWRIVERQAIWREGVLVLNLHIMGDGSLLVGLLWRLDL